MALVPVPALPATSGVVALLPAHSPFGVAVTADGRPRYHLVATFAGLPDPRTLGPYTTYVAWAYTLALDSAVKLGRVRDGRIDLGELDRVQFRILVTAERSAGARDRAGRLVLRGTSPSARLLMHRDFLQPSAPGALRDTSAQAAATTAGMSGMAGTAPDSARQARDDGPTWPMPPTPRWMPMMPGMEGLTPSTAPFRPHPAAGGASPTGRPGRVVRLATGDTLALEAGPVRRTIAGRTVTMYAFNGQVPGPLIEVTRGATIVVRFHNALDRPSSVHWHGVRLDNRFDGAVGVTQPPVPPGGTFLYTVHFPDAGIYWYHPHVREDIEQHLGLYGNLLVRGARAGAAPPVDREQVLALGDLLVGPDGLAPFGATTPTYALMGRFGNVLLVNGEPRYTLDVRRGAVVRFYLTNVSSARLYNISFGDAPMKVVGGDVGNFEREEWVPSVVIAPAERYIVDVAFPRSGQVALVNRVQALTHMIGSYTAEVDTLGTVRVGARAADRRYARRFETLHADAAVAADLARYRRFVARPPDRTLVLTMRAHDLAAPVANMLVGINAAVEWNDGMPMMNWVTTGRQVSWVLRDSATGKENTSIDWHFTQGDVVKLRLINDPASAHAMDHPIHLHGQRFLVLSRDGVPTTNLVWKDTALVPAGETVELLVDMANPGRWMLHCHIAEHLGAGMMMTFTVDPPAHGG